jgi:hypothetical protein
MGKLQIHTADQPASDITTFILSCNRLHLLERTIDSYLQTAGMVTKMVLLDDSGAPDVFEKLVARYGHIADIICFPENRGLWWAKDFMVSYCFTPYIFYLEDDWVFLQGGYLQQSKEILEKHREIGSVDISWRTFSEEGLDSYDETLVEDKFFYKKPWQITENHLHWFIWQNSPNLRRRTDLLLLGRIEEYYTEWNIDRKFFALGFKGCFLAGRYVRHIGDHESLMVNKRPREHATPETLFPQELRAGRVFPTFDYYALDQYARELRGDAPIHRSPERVLVTALIDIQRESVDGRNFYQHYLRGLQQLVKQKLPMHIFCDPACYDQVCAMTGGIPSAVYVRDVNELRIQPLFQRIKQIVQSDAWRTQAAWMQNSIISAPEYIMLTLYKLELLKDSITNKLFKGKNYYWIDAGLCSSYAVEDMQVYDLHKLPVGGLVLPSFPYNVEHEVHGYGKQGYLDMCGKLPTRVGRATLFGGSSERILQMYNAFSEFLLQSVTRGYVGTEEAIFTGLMLNQPDLFDEFEMPSGDIRNYLRTLSR